MSTDPYKTISRFYDRLFEPLNAGVRGIADTMWPPAEGMRVLDVGCGTGAHLERYEKAGCEVFGIDLSPSMLEVARQRLGERATLDVGDASELPFPDETFDLVLMGMALHEMPSTTRSEALDEARRVLKRDGRVLVIDFHPGPIRFPKGWWRKGLFTVVEFLAGFKHFKNYRDFLGRGGLPALSARHGLRVDHEKIVSGGNLGLFLLRRE